MKSILLVIFFLIILSGCVHNRWMASEFTVPKDKTQNEYEAAKKECIAKTERSTSKAQIILTGAIIYDNHMGKLYQSCMEGKGFPCQHDKCYY